MTTETFTLAVGVGLFVLMLPALYRVAVGPTSFDRLVAVNVIGTKTAVLLVVIGTLFDRLDMFVDFALAYALLNFVSAIVVSRYLNRTVPLVEKKPKGKGEHHDQDKQTPRVEAGVQDQVFDDVIAAQ